MAIFSRKNKGGSLFTNFNWDSLSQFCWSDEKKLNAVYENFGLDEDCRIAICLHCEDEFDTDKGMEKLINHLFKNHCGSIIEPEVVQQ